MFQSHVIDDEIRSLLDAPPRGEEAPSLGDLEHTLTAGYAHALALDAERWRLERKLAALAGTLGERSAREYEVAELGRRLSAAEGNLAELRALLSSLRARADEVRAAA